ERLGRMSQRPSPGRIVLLNGVPRSGKTSIARAIQESFDGVWMNLGVDGFMAMTPARYRPGIGLRPGGERPDLEPVVASLYAGLYEAIAAHSRLGVNVVADLDHHDGYSRPLGILPDCARRLAGLPAWLVGVRCPIEVIVARRQATWGAGYTPDGSIPAPVIRFQEQVHAPGVYDFEVDTSALTPAESAAAILRRIEAGPPPSALSRLAAMDVH
ncbi:MAG TPA: hypothetical protein VME40_10235, partial [Caulobacteraceae bacterium]|nr:hypothetical protein [Caulobacteraceae bacterium]